ncbi:hypothetical protein ACWDSJ_26405 [Nocardia sp. NPDC003482]
MVRSLGVEYLSKEWWKKNSEILSLQLRNQEQKTREVQHRADMLADHIVETGGSLPNEWERDRYEDEQGRVRKLERERECLEEFRRTIVLIEYKATEALRSGADDKAVLNAILKAIEAAARSGCSG